MDTIAVLLTEDETREVVSRYEERVAGVINRAVARWHDLPPAHAVSFSARTRACAIHDYIREEATAEFLADSGVTVTVKRGTVVLVFGGKVAVRFKKLRGQRLHYCVGPTHRQRAIHNQQLLLDGTDIRLTWATAGYRLDAAGELTQTALVVNDGDAQQFAFDLADTSAPLVVLPAEDDDDALVIRPAATGTDRADGTAGQ